MYRFLLLCFALIFVWRCTDSSSKYTSSCSGKDVVYTGPDTTNIPDGTEGDLIRYGMNLIKNTAYYIGPEGVSGKYLGNKMNCTNCHMDAGTRPYGFNFFSTYGNYPQYRSREDAILSIEERVNNCVERPHNGIPLPLESKEMMAIVSYIRFLGEQVGEGETVKGSEGIEISFMDRPADPERGKIIYARECARCHMEDGQGKWFDDSSGYEYPPLWGSYGYQPGSSMFRIIKAAKFIKANMPFDKSSWKKPYLTDEDAFDVAAYINNGKHKRPEVIQSNDYKNVGTKYVDYPFGPYNDTFTDIQHKFGPYQPIIDYRKERHLYINY